MNRHYETMFIVKPTLTPEETQAKIEFFKTIITKNGGSIEAVLDMGMRNLAYEIQKNKRGYYYVIYFKAPANLIKELERNYRINEEILRFIVLKYESKKEQKAWATLVEQAKNPTPSKELKEKEAATPESSESKTNEQE